MAKREPQSYNTICTGMNGGTSPNVKFEFFSNETIICSVRDTMGYRRTDYPLVQIMTKYTHELKHMLFPGKIVHWKDICEAIYIAFLEELWGF